MIELDCSVCDQGLKKVLGCEQPAPQVCSVIDDIEFISCPIKWVVNCPPILQWANEYNMCKEGLCKLPHYKNRQSRWYEAEKIYSSTKNKISREKQDIDRSRKTKKTLESLRPANGNN